MKFKKTVLDNGLRIIMVPVPSAVTSIVEVVVETGSEHERRGESGISHFLEHMCFKGTVKRPTSFEISREMDEVGALHNAETGNEYTAYYAKAAVRHFDRIFDIVSDTYLNATLPQGEIKKEQGVVLEEINMYEDDPQSKVWDVLRTLMYKDQPAGRPILGSAASVKSLTRAKLLSYRSRHYVPEATIVIVAGAFDEKETLKKIRSTFGSLPRKTAPSKAKVNAKQNGSALEVFHKKTEQTHFVLGFRGISRSHPDYWAVRVLQSILSGGSSSRLWHKMREELGICYYVGAYNRHGFDYGEFDVGAGVANDRLLEALRHIMIELARIKNELVTPEELAKAKDYRIGTMYLGLETVSSWADFYGFQEVFQMPIQEPEDFVRNMNKVTAEDIRRVANLIFDSKKINLAVVGPHKKSAALASLLETL